MKKSYFIFVVLCLGLLLLGVVFAGAKIGTYLSLPALVIVVFLPSFVVIGVYGLPTFFKSFRLAFQGNDATTEQLETGALLFKMLGGSVLLTGFITTMIGVIAMLANLMDAVEIGKMIAIALITLFYSLILIFLVAAPFKSACEKRLGEMGVKGSM